MRRIFAASLILAPLGISAAAHASQPVTETPASTPARPISTGVTPAHLVYSHNITLTPTTVETLPLNAAVVLKLNVDETGQAKDIQVVKSPDAALDAPVAAAVRQFRFSPAILDNQAVATDLTLTVVVAH